MNDKTAIPCVFCKGTGIEPGRADCVWCDNTGIERSAASVQSRVVHDALVRGIGFMQGGNHAPLEEVLRTAAQPDLLRDALEHIIKTVGQSRTQTRRLRWIGKRAELALEGRPYVAAEHDLPVSVDNQMAQRTRQYIKVRSERDAALAQVAALREELAKVIEDRARFPDRPDFIGNMISAHIGNLKAGKAASDQYANKYILRNEILQQNLTAAEQRNAELDALLDTPHTSDWFEGVKLESGHQIKRWGSDHDAGKGPADWFWLIGYLAQKAMGSQMLGDTEKAKHHTISTAAALLNWFRAITGDSNAMRPGIVPPAEKYPSVKMVKAHTHTCACVIGDSGVCDCGAVLNGTPVEIGSSHDKPTESGASE